MPAPVVTGFRINEDGVLRVGHREATNEITIKGSDFDPELATFKVSCGNFLFSKYEILKRTETELIGTFTASFAPGVRDLDPGAPFDVSATVINGSSTVDQATAVVGVKHARPFDGPTPAPTSFTLNGANPGPGTLLFSKYDTSGASNTIAITGSGFEDLMGSGSVTISSTGGYSYSPTVAVSTWSDGSITGSFRCYHPPTGACPDAVITITVTNDDGNFGQDTEGPVLVTWVENP